MGAYVVALMALRVHTPFFLNLVLAVLAAAALGALVGIPSLRINDDYFIIATFAFQVIVFSILNNWVSFTSGPMGLPGIPQPTLFGLTVSSHWGFLTLTWILAALVFLILQRLTDAPFGRVLKTIREDEVFAASQAGSSAPG